MYFSLLDNIIHICDHFEFSLSAVRPQRRRKHIMNEEYISCMIQKSSCNQLGEGLHTKRTAHSENKANLAFNHHLLLNFVRIQGYMCVHRQAYYTVTGNVFHR